MKRNDLLYKWWEGLGDVPDERFNLGSWTHGASGRPRLNMEYRFDHCGTTACAGGWLPTIFPDDWRLVAGQPLLNGCANMWNMESFTKFFGMKDSRLITIVSPSMYEDGVDTSLSTVRERIFSEID